MTGRIRTALRAGLSELKRLDADPQIVALLEDAALEADEEARVSEVLGAVDDDFVRFLREAEGSGI